MVPLPFLPLLLIILKPQALAQPSSSGSLDPLEDQALAAQPSTSRLERLEVLQDCA